MLAVGRTGTQYFNLFVLGMYFPRNGLCLYVHTGTTFRPDAEIIITIAIVLQS